MKSTYSYFSLRFPATLAKLCHRVEDEFNASYFDLPILLPTDSMECKYEGADTISFQGKDFFLANEKTDVCFKVSDFLQIHCFGLINISTEQEWGDNHHCLLEPELRYVFWTNFFDEKLIELLDVFEGVRDIRIYSNPVRVSATLIYEAK